jgi:hypothetical protein
MRRENHRWKLIQYGIAMLLFTTLMAQDAKNDKKASPGPAKQEITAPDTSNTPPAPKQTIFKPIDRPDPFLNPTVFVSSGPKKDEEVIRGNPPPGIAGTLIAQAEFLGTSLSDARRLAVIRGSDNRAYFLLEEDKLFDGYLKTIEPDAVTFIRETKMKSGKVITQEVRKQLRTQ